MSFSVLTSYRLVASRNDEPVLAIIHQIAPCADRVTLVNKALHGADGQVSLGVYEGEAFVEHHLIEGTDGVRAYQAPARSLRVPCTSMDSLVAEFPAIRHVFITINGAELEALGGMRRYFDLPGRSAWIKSPFMNAATGRPMALDVQDELARWGLRTYLSGAGTARTGSPMGKVFAFRPW